MHTSAAATPHPIQSDPLITASTFIETRRDSRHSVYNCSNEFHSRFCAGANESVETGVVHGQNLAIAWIRMIPST